jgi:hypothetical protein
MRDRLVFPDPQTASDALTFASRAARLTEDAVRLQASGGVLAMTAAALSPRGLGDATPTVLGMRLLRVDPELVCDLVVEAASLRAAESDPLAVVLPDVAVSAAWAGISPPRSGWGPIGQVSMSELESVGAAGVATVARALPANPGADVVRTVRAQVWSEPEPMLADLPRGTAFAAVALGFTGPSGDARLLRSGPWLRLELPGGHILVRGPQASGLTAVRVTGTPH